MGLYYLVTIRCLHSLTDVYLSWIRQVSKFTSIRCGGLYIIYSWSFHCLQPINKPKTLVNQEREREVGVGEGVAIHLEASEYGLATKDMDVIMSRG